jgi:ABC-type protease/lipase transport system fused ATPase/permease subunit
VALIGENGQGKTTIVKLITRLYDPTEGEILLDGIDLREYDLDDLHAEIGVIFQDFMRYEMTARENIAVGRVEVEHAQEEIEYAAEKSLASGVVAKLPGGYDQMLGRASKAASISPAANGKRWRWRAPTCAMRNCSFSMSRPLRSMRAVSSRSSSASPSSPTARWRF